MEMIIVESTAIIVNPFAATAFSIHAFIAAIGTSFFSVALYVAAAIAFLASSNVKVAVAVGNVAKAASQIAL